MSNVALTGNASGTGTLTITSPNTNTNRTLTLPDLTGTIMVPVTGTWTPVATPTSGAITTYTASGTYTKIGTVVVFLAVISITNNGTGAGALTVTLPIAITQTFVCAGRENAVNGNMLQGLGVSGGSSMNVFTYNNTYPGVTGGSLILSGTYVVAA